MINGSHRRHLLIACATAVLFLAVGRSVAADTLTWHTNQNRVSADIKFVALPRVLEGVAQLTGWRIYLESNTTFSVSARFQDLPAGQALRNLLGDLSFALVPQSNGAPHLYVFRSSQKNATQLIHPADLNASEAARKKIIPNELVVRLKNGANIDELARALGAKVIGRVGNVYRLQFSNETAANSARERLAGNSDVADVESNYLVDPPPQAMKLDNTRGVPPIQLKLNPPDSSGRVIVGLVDTGVQPLGNDLDKFLFKSFSVTGATSPDSGQLTHGTSMFENILRAAAAVSDGSSSIQVLSVNAADPDGTMNTFNVAAGIAQAVNNGPPTIINLSLGSSGDSPFLHDMIRQVTQLGIPVFAAAGNDGSAAPFYPAAYPEVISVTAGNQGRLASYANYGDFVDLMAPGSGVVYYGDSAFLVNGTSTAAAFVSGTVGATAIVKQAPINSVVDAIRASPAFKFNPPR